MLNVTYRHLRMLAATASLLCISAGLLIADAQAATQPIPSWYIGLKGGVNYVSDAALQDNSTAGVLDGNLDFDQGYNLGGSIGYKPRYTQTLWDNTRFEVELAMTANDLETFKSASGDLVLNDGDIVMETVMANFFVDLPLTESFYPYLGGGVGGARAKIDSATLGLGDEEDTVFAYQGMVGINYVTPSFPAELGVGYRYLSTQDIEFVSPATNDPVEMEYESHSLEGNVRFFF